MTALSALAKVADDLEREAKRADPEHPVDPEVLTVAAARIRAQVEIIVKQLD